MNEAGRLSNGRQVRGTTGPPFIADRPPPLQRPHQGRGIPQAAADIALASLSMITGESKYSIEGSAPRRSRILARQAAS